MVIFAGIPTLGHSDLLYPLVRSLAGDQTIDAVRVYDNGIESAPLVTMVKGVEGIEYIDARGLGLYTMWNQMIEWGRDIGANVAILNDDIAMAPGTLDKMAKALRSDDKYWICGTNYLGKKGGEAIEVPVGTFRHGGIGGWAFMVRSEVCPLIDEEFRVWYGDDDLCWKIKEAGGRACVARDAIVAHQTSTTINTLGWVKEAMASDTARWNSLGRP